MTGFGFLGRLKESYIQWTLKSSWMDVFKQIPSIVCVTGTIGFALKFTTYFENWYWLPTWPNICDAIFLAASALYLGLRRRPRRK